MNKKQLSFAEWITETGVITIAKELGVHQSAVRHWRLGRNLPRPEQMRVIKKLSKGQMTYDIMIDGQKSN